MTGPDDDDVRALRQHVSDSMQFSRERREAAADGIHDAFSDRLMVAGIVILCALSMSLACSPSAGAAPVKPRQTPHCESHRLSPPAAVRCVFPPRQQGRAIRLMRCESGSNPAAVNGQYRGLFQLGATERATYAYDGYRSALSQVRAAFNLWTWRFWQPWRGHGCM